MKVKSIYVCSECGYQSAKWLGKCPGCGEWNTLEEEVQTAPENTKGRKPLIAKAEQALPFTSLELPDYMRTNSGMSELDRVLGGGFVHGSVVLLAGEPGIGKSTLLLQISTALTQCEGKTATVLYTSGEESRLQLHYRAKRLGVDCPDLYVMTETDVDRILAECDRLHPSFLIVDSIQTLSNQSVASAPGTVSQVRECTLKLIAKAKSEGMSVIIVGHVNKEGGIAGPKVLEHMVDAVLYFEGDRQSSFRVIRASKN
ncbi:MAG: DNA repair protein RadA, partial [Ruminococcaceae bacterium]|nr:DNA repair protein RadA [Oscillospiraceae bacterium]